MKGNLKDLEGQEVWTDALGERACVGIVDNKHVIDGGKKIAINPKQVEVIWDDYMIQEFGGKEQMMKDLEAEFGVI